MKKYKAQVTYEYTPGTFIYLGLAKPKNFVHLSDKLADHLVLNYLDCVDLIKEFKEQATKYKPYNKKIVKIEMIEV